MTLSNILSHTGRFEIGLSCSNFSVGVVFGTGVMISCLYLLGQVPDLRQLFIISVRGVQKNPENLFSIFAGISPDIVDLLVFIKLINCCIWFVVYCGMSLRSKGGTLMSLSSKGL